AGKWHTVDPSPLRGGHVVVVADRDQPGEAHARDVVSSLTGKAASLRVVRAKVGKDAADHIAAGHGLDELEAAELPAGENTEPDDVVMPLDVICAADVELSRVRYLWDRRIPVGAVTVLPGEEGIGKTTVGIRLIADLTRGRLAGEFYGTPRNVLVLAAEDGLGDVFVPRLRQAGADLNRVHIVRARMAVDGSGRDVIVPRDLDVIGDEVRKHDAALVWIDSLVTTLPDELRAISYKDVARALKTIGTWASDEGVAVAAPWHLNKAQGTDTAVRMMDSRAFRTAVRSVLLIVTDPEAPEGTVGGLVALDKANAGTLAVPALRYHLQPSPYTLEEVDQATGELHEVAASCGVAVWRGEVAGDGREIARAALAPKIEREDGPDAWLRDYLHGADEIPRADVVAAAELVKISESAVKRAARKIGVHSREETGRDPVSNRPWKRALWTLPEQSGQQSGHPYPTDPTDPTDPTGEAFIDPTDPIYAGQDQSGQSGQSGQRGPTAPIEACKWTDWTMPLTPPPAHCATCDVELTLERAGCNTRCEPCWDELLAAQPGEAS
ncbi:MAG: AAA family ATPase, partial [Actinomycetota bacterium]|nr:AAA family ATPase [Actinomycetota bacterium]